MELPIAMNIAKQHALLLRPASNKRRKLYYVKHIKNKGWVLVEQNKGSIKMTPVKPKSLEEKDWIVTDR